MQRYTYGLALLLVNFMLIRALPLELILGNTDYDVPLTMAERLVSTDLSLKTDAEKLEENEDIKPRTSKVENTKIEAAKQELDNDSTPIMGKESAPHDDESIEIGEDDTPVNGHGNTQKENNLKPNALANSPPMSITSANPIYVTIPIYISTNSGTPLSLSVGERQIAIKAKETAQEDVPNDPPPTSQFNRLLDTDEQALEMKRLRNSLRSKIIVGAPLN